MISARNGIRLIRRLGFVLIALPEAFTTPIGLALILTARYLSKRIEAGLYKRLHGTFQHYLAHYKRREGAFGKPREQNQAEGAAQSESRPLLPWHDKPKPVNPSNVMGSNLNSKLKTQNSKLGGDKEQPLPFNWESQRQTPAKVIRHTMDWKKFSPHYGTITGAKVAFIQSKPEARPARDAKLVRNDIDVKKIARMYRVEESGEAASSLADTPTQGTVLHSLDLSAIQPYGKAADSPPAPPRLHAIDMASLERRFGAPTLR